MRQPSDDTEKLTSIDAADLLKLTFNTPPGQREEEEYRRGYGDGFIQAVDAFWDVLERTHGRDTAYELLWRFWETGALGQWRRARWANGRALSRRTRRPAGSSRRTRAWLSSDLPPGASMADAEVPSGRRRRKAKRP